MSRSQEPKVGRTFLVGCPRSGTTLLQSLIYAHDDVISFPETFFFVRVTPGIQRWRRTFHLCSRRARLALDDLDALGVAADPSPPPLASITVGGYARRFVRRMDRSAREAGASLWLEKTPNHARHIAVIEKHVPDARFLHIIRAGEAVAASLRDATDIDPQTWPSSQPRQLVEVWQRYLHYSMPYVGTENHAFVSYERLVEEPDAVMRRVCDFLDLRSDDTALDRMLAGYRTSSERLIGRVVRSAGAATLAGEPWKTGTGDAIANRNEAKFLRLFTEADRAEISAAVATEQSSLASVPFL